MTFTNLIKCSLAVGAVALMSFATPAAAISSKDAAYTAENAPVVDARGNCVRTKWMAPNDVCGAAPREPKEVSILRQEELTVYFGFDDDSLTPQAQRKLDTVASVLMGTEGATYANIVGYADRIGNPDYNMALSKRRAVQVGRYLAQQGYIDAKVAEVRALGESESRSRCEGLANRQAVIDCLWKDRKVEIEINYYKDQTY